jgi:hypothetical protein
MNIMEIIKIGYVEISPDAAQHLDGAQLINGQWYGPRWGCDSLEHIVDHFKQQPSLPHKDLFIPLDF